MGEGEGRGYPLRLGMTTLSDKGRDERRDTRWGLHGEVKGG